MNYEEENIIIELVGKGRKIRNAYFSCESFASGHDYYRRPKLISPTVKTVYTPKLSDMLDTASRKTQAIFKISSFGKSEKKIEAHLSYISQRGRLELEDQNGGKISSLNERRKALKIWAEDFEEMPRSRNTMHLVLSTPPGTDRDKAYKAAKEFLEAEYRDKGHEYLFVAHNDTDHPHIHAVIKMVSFYGNKLNPRKAYLHRVKQHFAKKCREYGIDVEASARAERGLAGQSQRSEFVQMKKSGRMPHADINLINKIKTDQKHQTDRKHSSTEKMIKRNQIIRKRYAEKAKALIQKSKKFSDKTKREKYQNAAMSLDAYTKTMPVEEIRGVSQLEYCVKSLNIPASQMTNDVLDEYDAVTTGIINEMGIYESPLMVVSKVVSKIIAEEFMAVMNLQEVVEHELDIDIDHR